MVACGTKTKSSSSSNSSVGVALDPANATYGLDGKSISLASGKSDVAIAPGSASHRVTTLTSTTASGDIDGDGKSDIAVVLTDTSGGSGVFSYLAAVVSSRGAGTEGVSLGD